MKKAFLAFVLLTQSPLGWASATGEKELVCEADLSPASFRPSQLVPLAAFLEVQAGQTKETVYAERFYDGAKAIGIAIPVLENFYKTGAQKGGARKGAARSEERFFLPPMGVREKFEKLVSITIINIYNSLCFVIPDMAERLHGHGRDEVTGPLFLKHKDLFDAYGRFCNFYVDALKQMHPESDLAKGARYGSLPGKQNEGLLFIKDDNDYLMATQLPVSPVSGLASSYFVPTLKRPYMGSALLYDARGRVITGCGLILNHVPGYDEIIDLGRGPERRLVEWQIRLCAPDFYLSPMVKQFETGYFQTENKAARKTLSETPRADEAMVDTLFASSVRTFLANGDLENNGVVDYVPLPTTIQDQRILRLLMLEEERLALAHAQEMETHIQEVGAEEKTVAPYADVIAAVEEEMHSLEALLVDAEIRVQQEAISKRVVRDAQKASARPSRNKGGKKRGGRNRGGDTKVVVASSSAPVSPSGPSAEMIEAARSHVNALKIEGRVKWRSLLVMSIHSYPRALWPPVTCV
ncbi:MAG: hypothetical protein LCH26_00485 [Proteobacteria bacterium]|nr:hypothetical protein [Pseudomonadota bacterium]